MKRISLLLVLVLMMVSALSIAGPAQAQSAPEVVTWQSVHTMNHPIIQTVEACRKAYNETAETPIEIDYEFITDRPTQEQKLKTMIASGNMPNFFHNDPNPYINMVAQQGGLVNIGELIDELGVRDSFIPFTLTYHTVDAGIYTLPFECNVEFFFYNKAMFKDAGCEAPETFDQFLDVCQKLKDKGYTPVSVCGVDGWPMIRYFSYLPFRRTGNEFIDAAVRGKAPFDGEVGLEALNFVAKMGGYFQEGFATTDGTAARDLFVSGKAAIFYTGTWDLESMLNKNMGESMQDNVGYFMLPTVENSPTKPTDAVAHAGMGYAISKEGFTDNVKAFVKYMIEHFAENASKIGGFIPAMPIEVPADADPLYAAALGQLESIETPAKIWDVVQDPVSKVLFEDELNAVAMGIMSPEEFAEKANETVAENAPEFFGN